MFWQRFGSECFWETEQGWRTWDGFRGRHQWVWSTASYRHMVSEHTVTQTFTFTLTHKHKSLFSYLILCWFVIQSDIFIVCTLLLCASMSVPVYGCLIAGTFSCKCVEIHDSILTVDEWNCLSSTDSHVIFGLTASLFVFLSPTSRSLCPFQPFTPHARVLPTHQFAALVVLRYEARTW